MHNTQHKNAYVLQLPTYYKHTLLPGDVLVKEKANVCDH